MVEVVEVWASIVYRISSARFVTWVIELVPLTIVWSVPWRVTTVFTVPEPEDSLKEYASLPSPGTELVVTWWDSIFDRSVADVLALALMSYSMITDWARTAAL